MPIHKTSKGYKWGGKGHTYASRKGAEKQAAAAYANGYTGKSLAMLVKEINKFVREKKEKKEEVLPYNQGTFGVSQASVGARP